MLSRDRIRVELHVAFGQAADDGFAAGQLERDSFAFMQQNKLGHN